MEFSEVASLINKLNSQKNIGIGRHFLMDGNNIYCFLIKSINCHNPYVPYNQPYYFNSSSSSFPSPTPHAFSNSNFTYSSSYEMELIKQISFERTKEGKITGIVSVVKELIEYCKTNNGDEKDAHYYDRVITEFVDKIDYEDFIDNLPSVQP